MVVLQHGQWELLSSHGNTQSQWNLWSQGRCTSISPVSNSSKHTAQSACSDDLHPSLLQLNFLLLFLEEENTSLCTEPRILCLCPWPHPSFLVCFTLPKLLCLQLKQQTQSQQTTRVLGKKEMHAGFPTHLLICSLASNLSLASLATCPSASPWISLLKVLLFWWATTTTPS